MDLGNPINCLTLNVLRSARHLVRGFEHAARSAGLTAPQFATLSVLSEMQDVSISDLSSILGTDRTTLTRNLDLMVEKGWIAAAPADDQRLRPFALTNAGLAVLGQVMPLWRAHQERLVAAIGEEQARDLLKTLERLRA